MPFPFFGTAKATFTRSPLESRRRIEIDESAYDVVYAIGDVHGRLDLLIKTERRIIEDIRKGERALVVMIGDYVDRGSESRGVIDHLTADCPIEFDRICLAGNHEVFMLGFLDRPRDNTGWLDHGGQDTLKSYGLRAEDIRSLIDHPSDLAKLFKSRLPKEHEQFLRDVPIMLKFGETVFVHAGIEPGVALDKQTDDALLWIREPFLEVGPKLPVTIVHGHTPTAEITFGNNRIGIDTGAYATQKLSAIAIRNQHFTII